MGGAAAGLPHERSQPVAGAQPREQILFGKSLFQPYHPAQQAVYVPHRHRGEKTRHAGRNCPAAVYRKCLCNQGQIACRCFRFVAVYARHRPPFRLGTDPAVRRPPRRLRRHRCRAQLSAVSARPVRRLVFGAGRLQLGRGQYEPRHPPRPSRRPAADLRKPENAQRNAQLRAQTAGRAQSGQQPAGIRPDPARNEARALFPHGNRQRPARHYGRRPSGQYFRKRISGTQSGFQNPGLHSQRQPQNAAAGSRRTNL